MTAPRTVSPRRADNHFVHGNLAPFIGTLGQEALEEALARFSRMSPLEAPQIRWISAEELRTSDQERIRIALLGGDCAPLLRFEQDPGLVKGHVLLVNDIRLDFSLRRILADVRDDLRHHRDLRTWTAYSTPGVQEFGTVLRVADGIAYLDGLANCVNDELLYFGQQRYGIAMNLEEREVGAMLLCDAAAVKSGDIAYRSGQTLSIPCGDALLGRIVNPLGLPLDGMPLSREALTHKPIEAAATRIIDRASVDTPLYTGITAIDAMIPIGRGQRELIIGDRQTGKTSIAIDTIINQRGQDVACIYVAIGQKLSTVASIAAMLKKHKALTYTCLVVASASDAPGMQYIAPYAGCAIAEEMMARGKDVLIVYDDLSKHAQAYRAISLLLRRPPGREAFPGDVFYIHSRLLERAAKRSAAAGGGSITALPIVETQSGDISAYIPTNVISITDGQIYLESDLFFAGQRPAINVGLSVSRIGGDAQKKVMRKTAGPLRISLAQYREKQAFSQFGSDVDDETRIQLEQGEKLTRLLRQGPQEARDMVDSVALLTLAVRQGFRDVPLDELHDFADGFLTYLRQHAAPLRANIAKGEALQDSVIRELQAELDAYKRLRQLQGNGPAAIRQKD